MEIYNLSVMGMMNCFAMGIKLRYDYSNGDSFCAALQSIEREDGSGLSYNLRFVGGKRAYVRFNGDSSRGMLCVLRFC